MDVVRIWLKSFGSGIISFLNGRIQNRVPKEAPRGIESRKALTINPIRSPMAERRNVTANKRKSKGSANRE